MSEYQFFSGTISSLLKEINLEKGDKLMPFTPFLGDIGLLTVGGRLNKAPLTYSAKHPLVLHSRSGIARLMIEKAHHDSGHQGVEHVKAHLQHFPDDWIEKSAAKSGEIVFHLQTMEVRQCETEDGRSAWIHISRCKQAVSLRQHMNGHVWTILHWGQERGHPDALRLLVHMPGHQSSPPRGVPWPLNRLSSHDHPQHDVDTLTSLWVTMAKTSLEPTKQWSWSSRESTSQTNSTSDCNWLNRTFSGLSILHWHHTSEESGRGWYRPRRGVY